MYSVWLNLHVSSLYQWELTDNDAKESHCLLVPINIVSNKKNEPLNKHFFLMFKHLHLRSVWAYLNYIVCQHEPISLWCPTCRTAICLTTTQQTWKTKKLLGLEFYGKADTYCISPPKLVSSCILLVIQKSELRIIFRGLKFFEKSYIDYYQFLYLQRAILVLLSKAYCMLILSLDKL